MDRIDEGVELPVARGVGIIARLGEDLGGGPQPASLGPDVGQVAGATLLGVTTPAAMLERSLRHLCSSLHGSCEQDASASEAEQASIHRLGPSSLNPPSVDEAVELVVAVAAGRLGLGKLSGRLASWTHER